MVDNDDIGSAAQAIAAAADRVMECLLYAEPARSIGPKPSAKTSFLAKMKIFDGVVLETGLQFGRYGQETVMPKEVTREIIWPVDVGIAHVLDDGSVKLVKARSTNAAAWRGRVNLVSNRMLCIDMVEINKDNIITAQETGPVAFVGGEWTCADKMMRKFVGRNCVSIRNGDVTKDREAAWLLMGLALSNRYEWSVGMRLGDAPELKVLTDAQGIGALFRDRSPGNRKRRAALAHWVANHWRQHRAPDPAMESYVRDHIRGADWFEWAGYECRVHVSDFDREREARAIAARAVMKEAGLSPRSSVDRLGLNR